jgi:hypothetical protein
MSKFMESVKKIQEDYGLDADGVKQTLEVFVRSRGKKYFDQLVDKYGIDLIKRAFEYVDGLPKIKWQNETPERWIFRYAIDNPKKLSSKEMKLFFDKDGEPKLFLHNIMDDPIDIENCEAEERDGETWVKEKPKEKVRPPKLRMPSEARLTKMDSNELGKLIQEAEKRGIEE